ncbi:MAG: universal stress protein [Ferrimicrobium sp.]|jgi:nucleotide-binding universal stress UspA family protein|uniref:Universal stress protein n=1 Tax=Ferrimicrobium acidiphilum TaxID=121039 RepID=A0ABV3Y2I3_9ACTN|nr:universal stress protein [Ferrimicrobium sp.]
MTIRNFGRVILGYDGSPTAKPALEFALVEAGLRNAELVIVYAWTEPDYGFGLSESVIEEFEARGKTLLAEAVEEAAKAHPNVKVKTVLQSGNAASRIIEQAENADLVVVGARGHGGFASLMLGSVSDQLVHHCPIPVTVVRD